MRSHRQRIGTLIQCAFFAALLAVSAWIQVPGAIPFTLQTMAVCIIGALAGLRKGILSLLLYFAIGAIGLPVFSGFNGGIGAFFGPTGGFIMGFVCIIAVIGPGMRLFPRNRTALVLSMGVGVALCYVVGVVWFMGVYAAHGEAVSLSGAISVCVIPFLLPECAKIATAAVIVQRLQKANIG